MQPLEPSLKLGMKLVAVSVGFAPPAQPSSASLTQLMPDGL